MAFWPHTMEDARCQLRAVDDLNQGSRNSLILQNYTSRLNSHRIIFLDRGMHSQAQNVWTYASSAAGGGICGGEGASRTYPPHDCASPSIIASQSTLVETRSSTEPPALPTQPPRPALAGSRAPSPAPSPLHPVTDLPRGIPAPPGRARLVARHGPQPGAV